MQQIKEFVDFIGECGDGYQQAEYADNRQADFHAGTMFCVRGQGAGGQQNECAAADKSQNEESQSFWSSPKITYPSLIVREQVVGHQIR